MAHKKEIFPTLKNLVTGLAAVLSAAIAGETAAGKIGSIGFAFKDSAGNLVLPTLTTEGKLQVDLDGAGISKTAGAATEVVGSLTEVVVASLSLNTAKTYGKISAKGSCFKEAVFKMYQIDDATETLIGSGIVGPGQYDTHMNLLAQEIVSGASGTQKIELRALNLDETSDFLGRIACIEFAI